jgi:flagellar protein FlgJ
MTVDSFLPGAILTAGSGSASSAQAKDSPEKIREAASQFEALLISQILKTAHEGDGEGWMGTGEDKTAASAMELGDEFFARSIAAHGGLGLAKMVAAGLARAASSSSPATEQEPQNSGSTPSTDR